MLFIRNHVKICFFIIMIDARFDSLCEIIIVVLFYSLSTKINVINIKTNHTFFLFRVSKEVVMEMRMQGSKLYPSNRSGNIFI